MKNNIFLYYCYSTTKPKSLVWFFISLLHFWTGLVFVRLPSQYHVTALSKCEKKKTITNHVQINVFKSKLQLQFFRENSVMLVHSHRKKINKKQMPEWKAHLFWSARCDHGECLTTRLLFPLNQNGWFTIVNNSIQVLAGGKVPNIDTQSDLTSMEDWSPTTEGKSKRVSIEKLVSRRHIHHIYVHIQCFKQKHFLFSFFFFRESIYQWNMICLW